MGWWWEEGVRSGRRVSVGAQRVGVRAPLCAEWGMHS